jgi:hypothetical protein
VKIKWTKPKLDQDQLLQLYTVSIFLTLTFLLISFQSKATTRDTKMTVVDAKRLCLGEGKTEGKDLSDCIKDYVRGLKVPVQEPTPTTQN